MANRSVRPYLRKKKNPSQEKAGGLAQGVGPEFKPQYHKKKKKKEINQMGLLMSPFILKSKCCGLSFFL
jgi:hypothetical protein